MNKERVRIFVIYALFIFIFSLVQFSTPDFVAFLDVKPDFLFVLTVLVGYLYGTNDAVVVGLISGFIKDAYAGRFLGLSMLIFLYCGIIASLFLKKLLSRNLFMALVQMTFATMIYHVSLTAISVMFFSVTQSLQQYINWVALNRMFPAIVMNTIVAAVMYFLIKQFGPYKNSSLDLNSKENSIGDSLWE